MIAGRLHVSTIAGLLVMLLAACGPSPTPRLAMGTTPPPDTRFTMADATILPARIWVPPAGVASRGVILALHGFADSRDAWELPAPVFAAAGWTLVAPDQRGFGGTAARGRWAGTATMIDDAAAMVAQLHARYPGARLVVMGESMGGAIALCLAARPDHPPIDDFVVLAPAVWGREEMGPVLSSSLWIADAVAPDHRFSGQDVPVPVVPSDNRDALMRLATDPLSLHGVRVRMLAGVVDVMDAAQNAAASVRGRMLVLDGRRDQVVPPSAAAVLWPKLPASVRRAFYPDGYHLLLRDRDRALVEADILAWLDRGDGWLPSGADVAAAAWQADHGWQGSVGWWLPASTLDNLHKHPVWPF